MSSHKDHAYVIIYIGLICPWFSVEAMRIATLGENGDYLGLTMENIKHFQKFLMTYVKELFLKDLKRELLKL